MSLDRSKVTSRRYALWLRRWWWLPLAGAAAAGVVAFVVYPANQFESTISYAPVRNNAALKAVGLDADSVSKAVPLSADAAELDGQAVRAEAEAAAGASLDVTVHYTQGTDTIDVVVASSDRSAIQRAKDFYTARITTERGQRVTAVIQSSVLAFQQQQTLISARIQAVDAQIASLSSTAPGELSAALATERANLNKQLNDAKVGVDLMTSLSQNPADFLAVTSSSDVSPVSGRSLVVVALAVAVALMILLGGYVAAHFRRTVVVVEDVQLAMGSDRTPVVTCGPGDEARFAAVLVGIATRAGKEGVLLVPVDGTSDAVALAAAATAALPGTASPVRVSGAGPLDTDAAAIVSDDPIVLVVRAAKTRADAIVRACRDLDVAGVAAATFVLVR